jgi:ribosomal protein L3 glutamine methyltransferase
VSIVTVQSYIEQLAERFQQSELFYGHGTDNPFDEAVYLVYGALDLSFDAAAGSARRQLAKEEVSALEALVNLRLGQRIPVAYLVGKAWFGGYEFHCDSRALIPRSPIAELINKRFQPQLKQAPERILDLCAGGGCIGIVCALQFPTCAVDLAELSASACDLARANVELHQLSARVQVLESNLFSALTGHYDLIITNPPYVSREEVAALPQEYGHEPKLGLLSEDTGLQLPLQILQRAADFLTTDGVLIMEVGYSQKHLAARLDAVPLQWLQFEHGGEGVFVLSRKQLQQYAELLV